MSALHVKVCGITRVEDARLAVDLGAWAIGFVFYAESSRNIAPARVGEILKTLGPTSALAMGVFVDQPLPELLAIVDISGLTAVQLHGDESPEYVRELRRARPALPVVRAFCPRSAAELGGLADYEGCAAYLLDAYVEGVPGGTGTRGPWALARDAARFGPILIAGGINAENIGEIMRSVRPWGVDLSSGLESAPGIKSPEKMRGFFSRLGQAEAS